MPKSRAKISYQGLSAKPAKLSVPAIEHQDDPEDEVVDVDAALGDDAARPPGNPRAAHQPRAHADERERADDPTSTMNRYWFSFATSWSFQKSLKIEPRTVSAQAARIAAEVRRARAMIVAIGFVPGGAREGAEASPTQTPGVSCSSPHGFATEVAGSRPIRQVPIWWAEKVTNSRGTIGLGVTARDERLEVLAAASSRATRMPLPTISRAPAASWTRTSCSIA